MQYKVIVDKKQLAVAFKTFKNTLTASTKKFKNHVVVYRPETYQGTVYWNTRQKFWSVFDEKWTGNRYWCPLGIEDPEKVSSLQISCEINSPYTGYNKRIGGVFLENKSGDIFVGHKGNIGGGVKGLGKKEFWKRIPKYDVHTLEWPDGKIEKVIVLGKINSGKLPGRLKYFIYDVESIRRIFSSSRRKIEEKDLIDRIDNLLGN